MTGQLQIVFIPFCPRPWMTVFIGRNFVFPGQQSDEVLIHLLPSYQKRELTFWGKIRRNNKKEQQQSDEVLIHLLPSYQKRELTFWGKIRRNDKKEHITEHLNFHTGNLRGEPISNNFFISTAKPCYTDSGLIRTPHYYRQDQSLGKPEKSTDLNGLQIHNWSQSLYALCRC